MTGRVKYFSLAGVAVLFSIFISAAAYSNAVYLSDCIKSLVIRALHLYGKPEGGVSIITGDRYRAHVKTYRSLPEGYFHFGRTLIYRAPKNIRVSRLTLDAVEYTDYYRLNDLGAALSKVNGITGDIINSGEIVIVPGSLSFFTTDNKSSRSSDVYFTRGLYFTGDRAGAANFLESLPYYKSIGINTVVFDVKDINGIVHTKNSRVREVVQFGLNRKGGIDNLPMLVRECRKNGIYLIARISVFRDHLLYEMDPASRVKSASSPRGWNYGTKELWCDPVNRSVQDYNIALAEETASAGVDEIQFDYIRFPTAGDQSDAVFTWSDGSRSRSLVIAEFLKRAHKAIASHDAFFSVDIFGVTAWGKDVDTEKLGQRIDLLAANCDIISPMLYPSHFNDKFDGFARPGDHPHHFIFNGCRKVAELAGGRVHVRPWLQAFPWRVSRYDAGYIFEQIRGANDAGARGYLFWNASNRYNEVFKAMESLRNKN